MAAGIHKIRQCSPCQCSSNLHHKPRRHRISSRSRQNNCCRSCSKCVGTKVRPRIQPTIRIRLRGSYRHNSFSENPLGKDDCLFAEKHCVVRNADSSSFVIMAEQQARTGAIFQNISYYCRATYLVTSAQLVAVSGAANFPATARVPAFILTTTFVVEQ
jgi:hypothetical protein